MTSSSFARCKINTSYLLTTPFAILALAVCFFLPIVYCHAIPGEASIDQSQASSAAEGTPDFKQPLATEKSIIENKKRLETTELFETLKTQTVFHNRLQELETLDKISEMLAHLPGRGKWLKGYLQKNTQGEVETLYISPEVDNNIASTPAPQTPCTSLETPPSTPRPGVVDQNNYIVIPMTGPLKYTEWRAPPQPQYHSQHPGHQEKYLSELFFVRKTAKGGSNANIRPYTFDSEALITRPGPVFDTAILVKTFDSHSSSETQSLSQRKFLDGISHSESPEDVAIYKAAVYWLMERLNFTKKKPELTSQLFQYLGSGFACNAFAIKLEIALDTDIQSRYISDLENLAEQINKTCHLKGEQKFDPPTAFNFLKNKVFKIYKNKTSRKNSIDYSEAQLNFISFNHIMADIDYLDSTSFQLAIPDKNNPSKCNFHLASVQDRISSENFCDKLLLNENNRNKISSDDIFKSAIDIAKRCYDFNLAFQDMFFDPHELLDLTLSSNLSSSFGAQLLQPTLSHKSKGLYLALDLTLRNLALKPGRAQVGEPQKIVLTDIVPTLFEIGGNLTHSYDFFMQTSKQENPNIPAELLLNTLYHPIGTLGLFLSKLFMDTIMKKYIEKVPADKSEIDFYTENHDLFINAFIKYTNENSNINNNSSIAVNVFEKALNVVTETKWLQDLFFQIAHETNSSKNRLHYDPETPKKRVYKDRFDLAHNLSLYPFFPTSSSQHFTIDTDDQKKFWREVIGGFIDNNTDIKFTRKGTLYSQYNVAKNKPRLHLISTADLVKTHFSPMTSEPYVEHPSQQISVDSESDYMCHSQPEILNHVHNISYPETRQVSVPHAPTPQKDKHAPDIINRAPGFLSPEDIDDFFQSLNDDKLALIPTTVQEITPEPIESNHPKAIFNTPKTNLNTPKVETPILQTELNPTQTNLNIPQAESDLLQTYLEILQVDLDFSQIEIDRTIEMSKKECAELMEFIDSHENNNDTINETSESMTAPTTYVAKNKLQKIGIEIKSQIIKSINKKNMHIEFDSFQPRPVWQAFPKACSNENFHPSEKQHNAGLLRSIELANTKIQWYDSKNNSIEPSQDFRKYIKRIKNHTSNKFNFTIFPEKYIESLAHCTLYSTNKYTSLSEVTVNHIVLVDYSYLFHDTDLEATPLVSIFSDSGESHHHIPLNNFNTTFIDNNLTSPFAKETTRTFIMVTLNAGHKITHENEQGIIIPENIQLVFRGELKPPAPKVRQYSKPKALVKRPSTEALSTAVLAKKVKKRYRHRLPAIKTICHHKNLCLGDDRATPMVDDSEELPPSPNENRMASVDKQPSPSFHADFTDKRKTHPINTGYEIFYQLDFISEHWQIIKLAYQQNNQDSLFAPGQQACTILANMASSFATNKEHQAKLNDEQKTLLTHRLLAFSITEPISMQYRAEQWIDIFSSKKTYNTLPEFISGILGTRQLFDAEKITHRLSNKFYYDNAKKGDDIFREICTLFYHALIFTKYLKKNLQLDTVMNDLLSMLLPHLNTVTSRTKGSDTLLLLLANTLKFLHSKPENYSMDHNIDSLLNISKSFLSTEQLDCVSSSDITAFACPFCLKSSDTQEAINNHTPQHTTLNFCPDCHFAISQSRSYCICDSKREKADVPEEQPAAKRCLDCGKAFLSEDSLRLHIALHKPLTRKPASLKCHCLYCDKSFFHAGALNEHIRNQHQQFELVSLSKPDIQDPQHLKVASTPPPFPPLPEPLKDSLNLLKIQQFMNYVLPAPPAASKCIPRSRPTTPLPCLPSQCAY